MSWNLTEILTHGVASVDREVPRGKGDLAAFYNGLDLRQVRRHVRCIHQQPSAGTARE